MSFVLKVKSGTEGMGLVELRRVGKGGWECEGGIRDMYHSIRRL